MRQRELMLVFLLLEDEILFEGLAASLLDKGIKHHLLFQLLLSQIFLLKLQEECFFYILNKFPPLLLQMQLRVEDEVCEIQVLEFLYIKIFLQKLQLLLRELLL